MNFANGSLPGFFGQLCALSDFHRNSRQANAAKLPQHFLCQQINGDLIGIDTFVVGLVRKVVLVLFALPGDEVTLTGGAAAVAVQTSLCHFINVHHIPRSLFYAPIQMRSIQMLDVNKTLVNRFHRFRMMDI